MCKRRKPRVWLFLFFVLWRSQRHVLCLEKKTTTTSEFVFMTRRSFLKSSVKNNHRLTRIGCRGHEIYWHRNNWDSLKSCCFKVRSKIYTFPLTFCLLRFCLNNFPLNNVANVYRPFVKIIIHVAVFERSTCTQEASELESENRKGWSVITNRVINVVIWNRKIFRNISFYFLRSGRGLMIEQSSPVEFCKLITFIMTWKC